MSSDAPEPKRHKRGLSANFADHEKKDPTYLARIEADLAMMKEKMTDEEHMLSSELVPALEIINDILQSLKNLNKYKRKPENQGFTIAAYSFSTLEERHLAHLGVQEQYPVSAHKAMAKINMFFQADEVYGEIYAYWKTGGPRLMEDLIRIAKSTSMITEAGRRTLVDRIIQEVVAFFLSIHLYAYVFPEIKLSVATDNPVSIRCRDSNVNSVEGKDYITFLTGSVDYLTVGIGPLGSDHSDTDHEAVKDADLLSHKTFKSLVSYLNREFSRDVRNDLKLFHIEAKREDGLKLLKEHRPQAIGETLATMEIKKVGFGVWCLTTGHEWLFGWLSGEHEGNAQGRKTSYMLESMTVDFASPFLEKQLMDIFLTMVYCFLLNRDTALDMA